MSTNMCDGGDLAEEILLDVKVTAVLKIGDFVLAGVGGNVELYSGSDFRKVGLIRVFQGASVHGLARDHAGQQEDVLQVMIWGGKHWAIIDLKDPQRPKFLIPEQIAEDWILDCCRSSDQLLLLTAHNQVLEQDLDPKSPLLRRRFVCDEKCILYSGSLVAGGGIVLAGTVFSELLVWSLTEGTVWHRIKGHEGVIFSVSFNPQERLLCTTSDDRSSRLWKVDIQGGNEDHSNPSNWASATITFVVALRGHSSRIFRHVWSRNTLITGGEDSKLLIWLDPANEKGEPSQIKAHSGSPVWALCTDPDKGLAYTGGGDGALRAWPSRTEASTKALKSPTEGEEKDQAIAVKFLTPCQILILTVGGNLYRHDLNRDEIQLIFSDDTLKNYGLVDTTFEGQILLGNLSGDLIRLNENESGEFIVHQRERIHEGKMFSLHVIGGQEVLTCGSEGSLQLMLSGGKTVSLRLPKTGDQRWVSSATISPNGSKLAVGDRCGSLHIYDLNGDSCDPEQTLKKIHGRLGIGDVVFASDSLLKSAGRDGLIKSSRFHNSEWTITSSEHLPIKWLERRAMSQGEELILGFQSSDFVVYSLSEQRPILEINCGGSHRSWDFVSNPGGNATFTFIKDKEVFISDIPLHILCKSNLKQPFHSREVSLVHHFALCDVDYLVTAGEDVVIKIHKLSNDCTKRQTILNLKSHISSVKTVKTLRLDDNTLLMASAGGRAQLTLWKISVDVGTSNLTVMELTSHLLKGNDRKRKKTWKDSETVFDTETRYMDLEIIRAEDGQIKIVTACSDGVLLVWNVSSDMKKLEQSCESPSIEHCFLRLCNLSGQIVSGSTDGFIRHWGVTNSGQIELEKEYRTHQSGVNSLHVSRDLVASGSDAGAIGLDDFRIPEQHACQITGIHRIGSKLITVSVDQRLTIWNFGGDKTLTFCGQILSDVADIQDMAVWSKGSQNFVAVAGEGLGIYKLRL